MRSKKPLVHNVNTLKLDPPQAKQKQFMRAMEKFVAYGGARGGGKTWALRNKATILAFNYAGIKILIMRRTMSELYKNHIRPLNETLHKFVTYNDNKRMMFFPNGSTIEFGYCDSEMDIDRYQGLEYDVIFMDEATQFTEYMFTTMTACLRGINSFPKHMYLTCNPGGVGHAWVKRLFVDRRFKKSEKAKDYRFIPARVNDNKILMKSNPDYIHNLETLPDSLKKMWLFGDWNVYEGQYFSCWNPEIHVVDDFEIPVGWRRYNTIDYGLDMFAPLWIAMNPDTGEAFVYRELAESQLIVSSAAEKLRLAEGVRDNIFVRYAPPDMWSKRNSDGKSPYEIFADNGLYFVKANNDRVSGWLALLEWMKPRVRKDKDGVDTIYSKLKIFKSCKNLIESLPNLQHDKNNPSDVDKKVSHEFSHAPDALRYWAISRPLPGQKTVKAHEAHCMSINSFPKRERKAELTKSYFYGGGQ